MEASIPRNRTSSLRPTVAASGIKAQRQLLDEEFAFVWGQVARGF